ncbi:LuxR C-terminal-related transcriptional regulator [Flavobacterium aurantiibacter]|nr:LuxR C-terminal-related transcriptional regulator [Flavobacterium aurantiibacter]
MKKTWYEIARYQEKPMDVNFELEIHKKLLEIFQVGEYYYYIFNPATASFEYVSDNVRNVMKVEKTTDFTPQYVFENMHPDDQNRFLAHEQKVLQFFSSLTPEQVLKYKVSYDYRLRCGDGSYKWILMQTVTIQSDDSGAVIRVIGVQTDISHLKTNNQPSGLSFIGLDGEKSYYNVPVNEIITVEINENTINLTSREKEVLRKIVEGKTSSQIADSLFISIHTVNSHRKKILQKTNSKSISELIIKVLNYNLL